MRHSGIRTSPPPGGPEPEFIEWVRLCGSSLSLASGQRERLFAGCGFARHLIHQRCRRNLQPVSQFVVEQIFTVVYATTMRFLNGLARSQATGGSHTSVINLNKEKACVWRQHLHSPALCCVKPPLKTAPPPSFLYFRGRSQQFTKQDIRVCAHKGMCL